MRQTWKFGVLLIGLAFLLVTAGYAQSLGDVARENRQKQQAKDKQKDKDKDQDKQDAAAAHKVITNEDMPEHDDALDDSDVGENGDQPAEAADQSSSGAVTRSGEQWKAAIQAQKDAIAAMQSQVDKLNASVHFVEANRYTNGVQYNQYQLEKQKQAQQMQKQLDEQKKKLEDMQEAARKAGFGSAVYDP
ncbi:MAG: hypothetical protein LAN83_15145 [Acidobacteriia bacterium]|nr:hypothetical protein [Terriglobia bacterium]